MSTEIHHLEPQFADLEHQNNASILGMWVYLATEILLFGGIIGAFLALRHFYLHDFEIASSHLNVLIAGINTVVLLGSSLTMAMAVHEAQMARRSTTIRWLGLTALLGFAFLVFKAYEYYTDWRDGLIPWTARFYADTQAGDQSHAILFILFYFVLTGLHAVHLTIGLGLIGWLCTRDFSREPATYVEVIGLYWHFVDMAWIFLLPLLYLSGQHVSGDLHF